MAHKYHEAFLADIVTQGALEKAQSNPYETLRDAIFYFFKGNPSFNGLSKSPEVLIKYFEWLAKYLYQDGKEHVKDTRNAIFEVYSYLNKSNPEKINLNVVGNLVGYYQPKQPTKARVATEKVTKKLDPLEWFYAVMTTKWGHRLAYAYDASTNAAGGFLAFSEYATANQFPSHMYLIYAILIVFGATLLCVMELVGMKAFGEASKFYKEQFEKEEDIMLKWFFIFIAGLLGIACFVLWCVDIVLSAAIWGIPLGPGGWFIGGTISLLIEFLELLPHIQKRKEEKDRKKGIVNNVRRLDLPEYMTGIQKNSIPEMTQISSAPKEIISEVLIYDDVQGEPPQNSPIMDDDGDNFFVPDYSNRGELFNRHHRNSDNS